MSKMCRSCPEKLLNYYLDVFLNFYFSKLNLYIYEWNLKTTFEQRNVHKSAGDWNFQHIIIIILYFTLRKILAILCLSKQGFLAYFIAVIRSYSQLKIVYYFPNPQEKNYRLKVTK
jgi:hypothetical protein